MMDDEELEQAISASLVDVKAHCAHHEAKSPVKWLLSGEQRTQMAKDGYTEEQILEVNCALVDTERELEAGTF